MRYILPYTSKDESTNVGSTNDSCISVVIHLVSKTSEISQEAIISIL